MDCSKSSRVSVGIKKKIIIIGGGISGLSVLHYCHLLYGARHSFDIELLECRDRPGGTIHTVESDGCYFENGPNGFLDSKPQTLRLIKELGLQEQLISARRQAKTRYLCIDQKLQILPMNPPSLFTTQLLGFKDKLRLLKEPFIPGSSHEDESVYAFAQRRFGEGIARNFFDPMVSGIYAGDAKKLNLRAVFPKLFELEKAYGSVIKGGISSRKKHPQKKTKTKRAALTSFRGGMGSIITTLAQKYAVNISLGESVEKIVRRGAKFDILSDQKTRTADHVFLAAPAYAAAGLVSEMSPELSEGLSRIVYAPVAVVGLVYARNNIPNFKKGFGYLYPSSEQKQVLGVLFESNTFEGRCPKDEVLLRIMLGGVRNPDIVNKSKDELIELATGEMKAVLGVEHRPKKSFCVVWKKAIPQYDQTYVSALKTIDPALCRLNGLYVTANYYRGVSFNDCITNAYQTVKDMTL